MYACGVLLNSVVYYQQEEHSRERQELEETQNSLTKELKLKYLIIENFIPPDEKIKITNRYDNYLFCCHISEPLFLTE